MRSQANSSKGVTAEALDEIEVGRKYAARMLGRFLALRDIRLTRLKATMSPRQQEFIELLPLLFHSNHPGLPGFVSTDCPAELPGYQPAIRTLQLARRNNRNIELHRGEPPRGRLRGLYLMGSPGTLGQDSHSDLDVWLCHAGDLTADEAEDLALKIRRVEEYGLEHGLFVHVFSMHAESFRDGQNTPISEESSGNTQHHLVLEEFYRTSILLAGRPPLWWLVPLAQEKDYPAFTQRLFQGRFIKPGEWLDFGGLHHVPAGEFLGSAHWLLHKAIRAPYKAMLKLMLTEAYAAEFPNIRWLCQSLKGVLQGMEALDADRLDPYVMMLERVTEYIAGGGDKQRLDLVRRSFYIKTGMALSRERKVDNWRQGLLLRITQGWGWEHGHLVLVDNRNSWKLEQLLEERALIAAELSACFRLLNNFARTHVDDCRLDARELSLIGRKLYAALEQRPGKAELLNSNHDYDLHEARLFLCARGGQWQLQRQSPLAEDSRVLKSTESLVELLAWLYLNGIADDDTSLLRVPAFQVGREQEHRNIFDDLRAQLPPVDSPAVPLEDFAEAARATLSLAFVNIGFDPFAALTGSGFQRTTDRSDALSYGGTHKCLVRSVDHLVLTTWGEVLVQRYADGPQGLADMLCRHLNLVGTASGEQSTVLQAYSHSSPRANAIATRVAGLATDVAEYFRQQGVGARYVFQAEDHFYLLEYRAENFRAIEIAGESELLELLREPQDGWRPLHIDAQALVGSALPFVLAANRKDQIQVFYQVVPHGIAVYVLDDSGALVHQLLSRASEHHFLVQQRRFFDSILSQRLISTTGSAAEMLATRVVFERLEQDRVGWTSTPMQTPNHSSQHYLDLFLITDAEGPGKKGIRLLCANREFDAALLGASMYDAVARYLLEHRQGDADYPVYLTGIQSVGLEQGTPLSLIRMVEFKHLLERRLTKALHDTLR